MLGVGMGLRGPRSMPALRAAVPSRPVAKSKAVLRAFLTGDREYFVRTMALQPWEDSPLVDRKAVCTHGHPIDGNFPGWGCHDQHTAWAVRQELIAEIARRGRLSWAQLDDPDDDKARLAWGALAHVAEAVGVPEERWEQILRNAGWKVMETDQQEDSDGE
jgi:hypothetical protein